MKILADENMRGLEVFKTLGEVKTCAGRELSRDNLATTDVLLVRSVTKVNADLLAGTPVGFVGSATIGIDHVDVDWLQASGITFSHAPGCNARAVVEYVLQAILLWCQKHDRRPEHLSLGIVGCGNVGSRLAAHAAALGLQVMVNDPPRAAAGNLPDWPQVSLVDVLDCDIVSLHVPLTGIGDYATRHLLGKKELDGLHACQLLINTCRGPVIDNRALAARLRQSPFDCVLDVWENEPDVPADLFKLVWLGSPHIAGYSLEGKLRGSWMLYLGLSQWLGKKSVPPALPHLGSLDLPVSHWSDLLGLLRHCWHLEKAHDHLKASLSEAMPGQAFDELRKQFPLRHELSAWDLEGRHSPSMQPIVELLAQWGDY